MRNDGRQANQLRPINVTTNYLKHAEGSCLIEFGETRVVCSATVEDNVPPFLKGKGTGWVTAEYGMLPRSCTTRVNREKNSGRSMEIQRLVGRALRGVVNMDRIGERSIKIDCDVIDADGGTRTASITGGFIALALALEKMRKGGYFVGTALTDYVAAISVGIHKSVLMLDLNYEEDSKAQMDMNVVMVGKGQFIEVQGTAEGKAFSKEELDTLLDLAKKGIGELIGIQKKTLEKIQVL